MSTPYQTIDEVVRDFAARETRLRSLSDRRCIFLTLYGIVSSEIRSRLDQRYFTDNAWAHRYAVTFANLYREALERYDAGRLKEVPKAWRLCFDVAKAGNGLVLQDMFLGINAHVNNDLPHALVAASIEPDRALRYKDHTAVNTVLGGITERATQRVAALYAPGLAAMDELGGQIDEMLSSFSLQVARDSAWESAVSLSNARNAAERSLVTTSISSRAAVMARLLLAPSLDPCAVAACRRLEAGSAWLTILAAAASEARKIAAGT